MKCVKCDYDDLGTGDWAHVCGNVELKLKTLEEKISELPIDRQEKIKTRTAKLIAIDESHLPTEEQSLIFRLRKRAQIRRQIPSRKSVQDNQPDRIADLLEEAAQEIERLLLAELNLITDRNT